ncbi:DUF4331 family protein [Persicobacter psychrovividus]|uniref:PKD domain-containing protein n=1 Tax=Persicobacter psychrovividus TaxID=387638 RepID=A0ABM7VH54_9BACT|nr:hypothetical protein PEPS_25800 [Persicobacter psychrovividus]
MKKFNIYLPLLLLLGVFAISCSSDDNDNPAPSPAPPALAADFQLDDEYDVLDMINLDGSNSAGTNLTYDWTVTDSDGNEMTVLNANTDMATFMPEMAGDYTVSLMVNGTEGDDTLEETITVLSPVFMTKDQMGRPAINTVFNFFGDADTKNAYNQTLPSDGAQNADAFKGIFDALQTYIGLDPATYTNILGLDNATTASVLAVDVLQSDKSSATSYGTLNGRGLADDVVDVTLILTFGGPDLNNINDTQKGLISDFVNANDKEFSTSFPYVAAPN